MENKEMQENITFDNIKVRITDNSKLCKEYQECVFNGTYDNTSNPKEIESLFNTLKTFDSCEKLKQIENLSFSKQEIDFEIITDDFKIPLKVRLGEGHFEKGLDELIKLGSKNIDTNINKKINPDIKEKFDKILSPLKPENFQNILNGTFEVIKEAGSLTNTNEISSFIQEFLKAYKKTQKLSENNKTIDNPKEDKKKDKNYFLKKVDEFFQKKLDSREREHVRTNEKSFSKSI
ncbi:TPA: hypothetical protein RZK14_001602 [Campylobacter coli]|nr:hypothetical protein [Campylobacter coli]